MMKKQIFSKLAAVAMMLSAVVGCQKADMADGGVNPENGKVRMSTVIESDADTPQGKATVDYGNEYSSDGERPKWEADDKVDIHLFGTTGTKPNRTPLETATFSLTKGAGTAYADFEGALTSADGTYNIVSVYPKGLVCKPDSRDWRDRSVLELYGYKSLTQISSDPMKHVREKAVMVGTISNGELKDNKLPAMTYKPVTSLLHFRITDAHADGTVPTKITVSTKSNYNAFGSKADYESTGMETSYDSIMLAFDFKETTPTLELILDGAQFDSKGEYHAYLPTLPNPNAVGVKLDIVVCKLDMSDGSSTSVEIPGNLIYRFKPGKRYYINMISKDGVDMVHDATNDIYQIYTSKGLQQFSDMVNGTGGSAAKPTAAGKLMRDIVFAPPVSPEVSNFTPIGSSFATPYSGVFDGNGKTIQGIVIDRTDESNDANKQHLGVFGNTSQRSVEIKNLTVKNITIKGSLWIGGLVGSHAHGTVDNCHVVNVTINASQSNAGGLIGQVSSGTISNSSVKGCTIVGSSLSIGGFVGSNSGNINNCSVSAYAKTKSEVEGASTVGGFAGQSTGVITSSYAKGVNVSANGSIGGFAGTLKTVNQVVRLIDCYATDATVSSTYARVGGLVGTIEPPTSQAPDDFYIFACHSDVTIEAPNQPYVGGLVGRTQTDKGAKIYIKSSYFAGTINNAGASLVGTLVGAGSASGSGSTISLEGCAATPSGSYPAYPAAFEKYVKVATIVPGVDGTQGVSDMVTVAAKLRAASITIGDVTYLGSDYWSATTPASNVAPGLWFPARIKK